MHFVNQHYYVEKYSESDKNIFIFPQTICADSWRCLTSRERHLRRHNMNTVGGVQETTLLMEGYIVVVQKLCKSCCHLETRHLPAAQQAKALFPRLVYC